MVISPITRSVRRALWPAAAFLLGTALLLPAADAAAEGRRARLSADVAARLRDGDTSATDVILTLPEARLQALVVRHGLRIRKRLQTGALVQVPAGGLDALTRDPGVDAVAGNHRLWSQMTLTTATTGASQVWDGAGAARGITGRGVGVAIIDSGIAAVPELRGHVLARLDFTGEGARLDTAGDRFGHGTHVAGIVAAANRTPHDGSSGMAPDAHLVSLKVLDAEGQGTAADVIEAIDWVVSHRARYRLRVINLSLGGTPMQSWRDDPLCQAVARAHDAGIVVVASAGNKGKLADGTPVFGGITVPGTCAHAVTVGALNAKGTVFRSDDEVASYSSRGPTRFDRLIKPDLVAPGNRVVSLLAPGSTLAERYPELVIGRGDGGRLQLSGTSMAAAVVSGAAALVIQEQRRISPVGVRVLLQRTSERMRGSGLLIAGAGAINVFAAAQGIRTAALIGGEIVRPNQVVFAHSTVLRDLTDRPSTGESSAAVAWGFTLSSHSDNILWGSADNILWGSADNILWGSADNILWGSADNILWGSADNILWGSAANILWGSADNILWGSAANILWGSADNILRGSAADAD